jgi:hypothetical protein
VTIFVMLIILLIGVAYEATARPDKLIAKHRIEN